MGISNSILPKLLDHWKKQNIGPAQGKRVMEINEFEKGIVEPFLRNSKNIFWLLMEWKLYPNYTDNQRFLFYPLEALVTAEQEFGIDAFNTNANNKTSL
jgi:hypothetical protein